MKKILKYTFLIITAGLVSCGEWVEPQSLPYVRPDETTKNPEMYARYLEALRAYKLSDHKISIGWFDNVVKHPVSYGHFLSELPDSIDFVALINPDNLSERELNELSKLRNEKMTRSLYSVSYQDIEKAYGEYVREWNALNSEPDDTTAPMQTFVEFMTQRLSADLKLTNKWNYDGLIFKFEGYCTDYLPEEDKLEYEAYLKAYIDLIENWIAFHPGKLLFFQGNPQYLTDKSILEKCEHIILETDLANNAGGLTFAAESALAEGVPTDRFVVMARPYSKTDNSGHFWSGGVDIPAILGCAYWVSNETTTYSRAGLGIYDIAQDFYNTQLLYQYTREAIEIMNPHPKY